MVGKVTNFKFPSFLILSKSQHTKSNKMKPYNYLEFIHLTCGALNYRQVQAEN
jgi:hypothetical protein